MFVSSLMMSIMSIGIMIIVMLMAAVFGYPLSFLFERIVFKMHISDTGLKFITLIAGVVMMAASGLLVFFSGILMIIPSYENFALMMRCVGGSLSALIICMAVLFAFERYESMLNETDDVDDEPVESAYVEDETDLSESLFNTEYKGPADEKPEEYREDETDLYDIIVNKSAETTDEKPADAATETTDGTAGTGAEDETDDKD